MIKILTIVGARPQFVKAAAFSNSVKQFDQIQEIIVHTGQHYDTNMSKVFFDQMSIPKPNYQLKSGGKSNGEMTGYQLGAIEKILIREKPNWVILYGDTNSTLAGAIAASKLNIPIAHIESGLRSFNMQMPEEINRIVTDRLSTLLFCPTQKAFDNLKNEGFQNFNCKIKIVGDIMLDAMKLFSSSAHNENPNITGYALCTLHRAENVENIERLNILFQSLNIISRQVQIILPLHPRTKEKIQKEKIYIDQNIKILEPLPYNKFVNYIKNSEFIISDSGGIQKEAYFLNKNCIILREETEWMELVERKNNIIGGVSKDEIIEAFNKRKNLNQDFSSPIYGNGSSSNLILETIINFNSIS